MSNPRIVIADDNQEIVGTVSRIIDSRYELVGVCNDGESAVRLISKLKPDVALLDIFMPGLDGIEVVSRLRVSETKTKVVILTSMEGPDYVNLALNAGANGFVVKKQMHRDLHKAIETVLSGAVFVSLAGEM